MLGPRPAAMKAVLRMHPARLGAVVCVATALLAAVALCALSSSARAWTQIPDRTITAAFPSGEPKGLRLTCTAAILIDADSGKILSSHNANARLPMASTTKIMTAILVLESLELDKKVKISANAVSTIGSKASLVQGETLTVKQLLYALMVVSGNDAGTALAEATAGSVSAFVEKMNAKAKTLGLTNTHFVNPCGLNNQHHFSSAKDLATLAQYALKNPVFARIVNTVYFDLPPVPATSPGGKQTLRKFDNQNELLKRLPWVTGVKTGSTPYAKYCLVASGTVEGVNMIAVVLGAKNDATRWNEGKSLLEYGFALNPRTVLADQGEVIAELDVGDPLGRPVRLVSDRSLTVRLSVDDVVTASARLDRPRKLPVEAGDVFGDLEFTRDGVSLGSVNLIAARSLPPPTINMIRDYWRDGGLRRLAPVR